MLVRCMLTSNGIITLFFREKLWWAGVGGQTHYLSRYFLCNNTYLSAHVFFIRNRQSHLQYYRVNGPFLKYHPLYLFHINKG